MSGALRKTMVYLGLGGIGLCTRRRPATPLFLLRVGTAAVVIVAGLAAWQLPWFELLEGVAMLTVVAVAHAFAVPYLRAETEVVAALE